jgi:hypothetical protein
VYVYVYVIIRRKQRKNNDYTMILQYSLCIFSKLFFKILVLSLPQKNIYLKDFKCLMSTVTAAISFKNHNFPPILKGDSTKITNISKSIVYFVPHTILTVLMMSLGHEWPFISNSKCHKLHRPKQSFPLLTHWSIP